MWRGARETIARTCEPGQLAGFNEARKCPQGEVPSVFVPVGTPGGHSPNQK